MFKIRNSYRLILSTLLLMGVLLLQFHYHDHEENIENCPICIVQEVFDLSDAPSPLYTLAFVPFIYIGFSTQTTLKPLQTFNFKLSRAPPKHS